MSMIDKTNRLLIKVAQVAVMLLVLAALVLALPVTTGAVSADFKISGLPNSVSVCEVTSFGVTITNISGRLATTSRTWVSPSEVGSTNPWYLGDLKNGESITTTLTLQPVGPGEKRAGRLFVDAAYATGLIDVFDFEVFCPGPTATPTPTPVSGDFMISGLPNSVSVCEVTSFELTLTNISGRWAATIRAWVSPPEVGSTDPWYLGALQNGESITSTLTLQPVGPGEERAGRLFVDAAYATSQHDVFDFVVFCQLYY